MTDESLFQKAKALKATLPKRVAGIILLQKVDTKTDSSSVWIVRIQRYKILAYWRFPFFRTCTDAKEALARAANKTEEILSLLEEAGIPARSRADLIASIRKRRPKYPNLPAGISPVFATKGNISGYRVAWNFRKQYCSKRFMLSKGFSLKDAIAYRAVIERKAVTRDNQLAKNFSVLMVRAGATLSESRRRKSS